MVHSKKLSDCLELPWKNGGGVTRELYKAPGEPFPLRISVATVSSDGPFSLYPEHDRILILLQGSLQIFAQSDFALHPYRPWKFSGKEEVKAKLVSGIVRDFNVIYRKGMKVEVEIITLEASTINPGEFYFDGETLFFGEGTILFQKNSRIIKITT